MRVVCHLYILLWPYSLANVGLEFFSTKTNSFYQESIYRCSPQPKYCTINQFPLSNSTSPSPSPSPSLYFSLSLINSTRSKPYHPPWRVTYSVLSRFLLRSFENMELFWFPVALFSLVTCSGSNSQACILSLFNNQLVSYIKSVN